MDIQVENPVFSQDEKAQLEGFTKLTVKYTGTVNVGNYSSVGVEAWAVIDLPPNTTQEQMTQKFSEVWSALHHQFGVEVQKIAHQATQIDFNKVNLFVQPLRPFITVFKTLWGWLSVTSNGGGTDQ